MPNLEIKKSDIFKVPFLLLEIVDGLNIRKELGNIPELAESIRENGLKVPLRGYRNGEKICVVDGHRRYAAMKLLHEQGVDVIASVILETRGTNEEQRIIDMVLTNDGKKLEPLELSEAIRRLIAYEYTELEIAKRFGKSPSYINRLNSLNSAPQKLRKAIEKGKVSATLAMDMIAGKRLDELMEKLEAGEALADSKEESIAPALKKITNKHVATLNSWKEFKKLDVGDVDLMQPSKREVYEILRQIKDNEMTAEELQNYFTA